MHKIDKNIEIGERRLLEYDKVWKALMNAYGEIENVAVEEDLQNLIKEVKTFINDKIGWVDEEASCLEMEINTLKDEKEHCIKIALDDLEWNEIELVKYENT